MISWMQRRPLIAALAFLGAVLAGLIALESGVGARLGMATTAAPPQRAALHEANLLPPVAPIVPEQAYAQVTERPLFTPTRRPAPPEPVGSKQPAFNRGQFVLQGVIVVGEGRTALLREVTSGRIHRVERGREVNGIRVEKIESTEVTLAQGGERETVALAVQKPGAGAPAAASAPQQGPFSVPPPPAAPPGAAANTAQATPAGVPTGGSAPVSGVARGPSPGSPETARIPATPSTQPMSPEELLARRRARRNQPTTQ